MLQEIMYKRNKKGKFIKQNLVMPTRVCLECNNLFQKNPKLSITQWNVQLLCSRKCFFFWHSKNLKGRFSGDKNPFYGKKHTKEAIEKISGINNHLWKGGIYPLHMKIRTSWKYKMWRKAILKRDNFMCIECASTENLNADHIKPFAFFPKLRFELSNGRTLCRECHQKTDTWGNRKKSNLQLATSVS